MRSALVGILLAWAACCAGCSSSSGVPEAPLVAAANLRAKNVALAIVAAQDQFRAANGRYARSLDELHFAPPDQSYIDLDTSYGLTEDVAVRLTPVDASAYVVTTVAGSVAPPPYTGVAPEADFLPAAPFKSYLADETGKVTDKPQRIAELTVAAVNALARSSVEQLLSAERAYQAANGGVAGQLADLYAVIPPLIDSSLEEGVPGAGVEVHVIAEGPKFTISARAGSGTGKYKTFFATELGEITEQPPAE